MTPKATDRTPSSGPSSSLPNLNDKLREIQEAARGYVEFSRLADRAWPNRLSPTSLERLRELARFWSESPPLSGGSHAPRPGSVPEEFEILAEAQRCAEMWCGRLGVPWQAWRRSDATADRPNDVSEKVELVEDSKPIVTGSILVACPSCRSLTASSRANCEACGRSLS